MTNKKSTRDKTIDFVNLLLGAGSVTQDDFLVCPACGLFTNSAIKTCVKCKAKCCTNCQAVDGTDCMACGVSPEWLAAVNHPASRKP